MKEKRRHQRVTLSESIKLHDIINDRTLGELVNIAMEGLMVICDEHIDTHSILQLSFELPQAINGLKTLEIGVDCLWCRKADHFHRYWAGFQIIDISEETSSVIATLIEDYKERDA